MVQVRVSEGLLEGEFVNNEYGGTFFSYFKGIPYAQPPLGDLRFKAPQPPKPWEGVRPAKEFGSKCYQNDIMMTNTGKVGAEDCLYLNVYTPDVKPKSPLPVMFWIHGGGFICGGGDDDFYGPEFLLRQGVVVVTINYRLEVLGFLSLNTPEIPGNAGMKDQVQALRWVNKNIANFGGDPKNITIFGESVGGASITYHLISPMSKGLFKRAIAQSGTSLCDWAQSVRPRDRGLALARQLGCSSEDDKELYNFFKNQPIEKLADVKVPITLCEAQKGATNVFLSIVDEKDFGQERFFYGDMVDVVSNGVHEGVDIMTGFTADEGLMSLASAESANKALEVAKNFPELFVPKFLSFKLPMHQQLEMGAKIRKFYFENQSRISEGWEKWVEFLSMAIFVFPTVQWVKLSAPKKKNKFYVYKFTCVSERNVIVHLRGLGPLVGSKPVTCHADDLLYLFNAKLMNTKVDTSSATFQLIDRVTKLWSNFAKSGNPTPDDSLGAKWEPYTLEKQEYLNIGNVLTPGVAPEKDEVQFWENLLKEYGQ